MVRRLRLARSSGPTAGPTTHLLGEARELWADVQPFVRDHGFAYSSQRIQDLSTRLSSSTATIWFIDVYDYLQEVDSDSDRPLLPYALGASVTQTAQSLFGFYEELKDKSKSTSRVVSHTQADGREVTLVEDQAYAVLVALGKEELGQAEQWVLQLAAMHRSEKDTGDPTVKGPEPRAKVEASSVSDAVRAGGQEVARFPKRCGPPMVSGCRMRLTTMHRWWRPMRSVGFFIGVQKRRGERN